MRILSLCGKLLIATWAQMRPRQQQKKRYGPVTLLRTVLAYVSVWKISIIRWYTLTYARGTLGIGCMRFKYEAEICF